MADPIVPRGGAPVTMGPAGLWLDANGDVAATDPTGQPQVTPGEADTIGGTIYHDPTKNLDYTLGPSGQKQYIAPSAMGGQSPQPGGSFLTNRGTWNPQTGSYDQGVNWGNLASAGILAGLTAGVGTAALGGAAGSEAAAGGAGADLAGGGAAALPSTAIGTGAEIGGVAGGGALPATAMGAGVASGAGATAGGSLLSQALTKAGTSGLSQILAGQAAGAQGTQNELNTQLNKFDQNQIANYGEQLQQAQLANQTAVTNPERFAGQSMLADILSGTGRVGASPVNPSAQSLATLNNLKTTAATNEANSPRLNPVPSIGAVQAPTLTRPTTSPLANVLGAGSLVSGVLSNFNQGGGGSDGNNGTGGAGPVYDGNMNLIGQYDNAGNYIGA